MSRAEGHPPTKNAERHQTWLLVAGLLAVGALAWSFELRAPLAVDAAPLDRLPRKIGAWQARDLPLESGVESILRADYNVQRVYLHPFGEWVALYVGYYGTERGGRPEHTPWVCYPTAGWRIEARRTLTVDAARGLRVNEFQVEKGEDRSLVHFWYRSHRATGLLNGFDQFWDRLVGRLADDRSDGALVRLSTPIDDASDVVAARSRLMSFGQRLDVLLDEHWPEERAEVDG